ncbi:HesA/MoeB/ThiF family protein [Meridianimarinicoccus sp. MJW13]|uniref:HesA/MoeB/ThiF family protein n=1 Tax=Meridianimarinicoccus sp. MJW13 TaxID=2720031 RepID=UPI001867DC3E|nr:HesA/MoeB/ThiF family protein [Fluviibacterium sp. MJW13]
MALFLAAAAGFWGLGWMLRMPLQARALMIGLLYLAVIAALLVLPEGAPLRQTLGGSAGNWLVLGALGGLAYGYAVVLKRLRARVRPENKADTAQAAPDQTAPLTDAELDRYARHIVLRELGGMGQRRLKAAQVLVIGAGGLGAPVLEYLGAAGVGTLGVIDDDVVDASNLQRQVIHSEATLGMPKVFSAQTRLRDLNPHVILRPYHRRLTEDIAHDLIDGYDLVLDGCDDFATRALVNRTCVALGKPLISGAITQWEGQLALFDPATGGPCYACIFPQEPAAGLAPSCAEGGVIGPLPGVIGTMMAVEAIKRICEIGAPLNDALLIYDGLWGETRRIALTRNPDCPVCGAVPSTESS